MRNSFATFANRAARFLGSPVAFAVTVGVIVAWTVGGLILGFTDTYQLWVNTISTLTTSVYVVLIQASQNRDGAALHLKLDELIRQLPGPRDEVAGVERLSDMERARLAEGARP